MRLTHLAFTAALLILAPVASFAAGATASVRAIGFVALHQPGRTDPQLAPYESILRANLRFESFRYTGESSASVSAGGRARLSLPNGGTVELESDNNANVSVKRGGAVIAVSPGHPAVFMGGPAGKNEVAGVIVMAN